MGLLVALVLCFTGSACSGNSSKPLSVEEAIDSINNYLPDKSIVVARFPDEQRHGLYYLNSGVMYFFDAKTKNLEEIGISGINSGNIQTARLTEDEKFIMIQAKDGQQLRAFRLNTENRNIVDLQKSEQIVEQDTVKTEKEEKKAYRPRKKEEPTEAAAPVEEKPKEPAREDVFEGVMEEPAGM